MTEDGDTHDPFRLDTQHVDDQIGGCLGAVYGSVIPGLGQVRVVIRMSVTTQSDRSQGLARGRLT